MALAALLVAASAHAEEIDPTILEGEQPVAVRTSLDGTTARISVDFRVVTAADGPSTLLDVPLPLAGVVTGATITYAGTQHRMTLDSTENVEKQFTAAFENPSSSANPRTFVVKIDGVASGLASNAVLVHIGAPRKTELLLTLEIAAATCVFRDARWVRLPDDWSGVSPARPPSEELAEVCGIEDLQTPGIYQGFPAREATRRRSGDRLHAATARLAIDNELHLARTELSLAANIADVPHDLATVILIDESRSMTTRQRRAQREIVLGYLRAAPNSRVQVIAFSRRTRAVLPGWMIASRALPRVERDLATLTPRNGSSFDLGLTEAGRLLSSIASMDVARSISATRRVLLVTDEALASRLATTPEKLASLVPPGTIINVAVTTATGDVDENGNGVLARHDGARLARLAATTSGFSTSLGEIDELQRAPVDATMLVRPISLDHIQATGLGWSQLDEVPRETLLGHTCEGSLPAGQSCVWWTRGTRTASTIQLEGLLWNRRVVRLVRPLADVNHTIAREIVATNTAIDSDADVDDEGNTSLGKRIDALARAVTTTTSLFVRWGVPEQLGGGAVLAGRGGFGRSGGIGGIRDIGGMRPPTGGPLDLAKQLRPLVARCGIAGIRTEITLELTFQEIVDVEVSIDATGAHAASARTCVEDVVWDFTPGLTLDPSRTETVVL